jgi:hypothetical protein
MTVDKTPPPPGGGGGPPPPRGDGGRLVAPPGRGDPLRCGALWPGRGDPDRGLEDRMLALVVQTKSNKLLGDHSSLFFHTITNFLRLTFYMYRLSTCAMMYTSMNLRDTDVRILT